jgi:alditol oxidase
MTAPGQSWAGTHVYAARRLIEPESVDELRDAVASTPRIRALGSRHSFNDVADTDGDLVSLARMSGEVEVHDDGTATVSAATPFGVLARELSARGRALHNLGSLPHISVAGAVATGTHGSGDGNGNLSSAVVGLEWVGSDGEIRRTRQGDADFAGSVISLGALGIVTRVTLRTLPAFDVRQDVYTGLPWSALTDADDEVFASGYSVSAFLHWGADTVAQLWVKRAGDATALADAPASLFGAERVVGRQCEPVESDENNTTHQGTAGPWNERLPHFRFDATPSNGDEIQTEYFVAREHGPAAIAALRGLGEAIDPHLMITELRTVAADDLWLSPTRGRASLAIHFTWRNEPDAVRALLPRVEEALHPFDAAPHWGKWFTTPTDEIARLYPRLDAFRAVVNRADPATRFRNAYLARTLAL